MTRHVHHRNVSKLGQQGRRFIIIVVSLLMLLVSLTHFLLFQITLHISYIHAIVNPTLFMVLHKGLRRAVLDMCCGWVSLFWGLGQPHVPPPPDPPRAAEISLLKSSLPPPAHPDSSMVIKYYM